MSNYLYMWHDKRGELQISFQRPLAFDETWKSTEVILRSDCIERLMGTSKERPFWDWDRADSPNEGR
jgi:hypothetical protein